MNIKRSLIVNVLIIMVSVLLFRGISYSMDNDPNKDNKNLLIKTGNMQVVLSIPNEKYELLDNNEPVSDAVGINQTGYTFEIENTGSIPIEYYEIRLVDQEGKVTTLPHKYLKFVINKDDSEYSNIINLGDNDSILYTGSDLDIGKKASFNLKMWISEEANAYNKELYGAIEITLYQKFDVYKNYVLYDSSDSVNVPIRTLIYNPITTVIPQKEGYVFEGWATKDKTIRYNPGDTYQEKVGTTLYAIWEKE